MYEIDDCGDGTRGWECALCLTVVSEADEPCEAGQNDEPCYAVDNEWGGSACLMCGRDM